MQRRTGQNLIRAHRKLEHHHDRHVCTVATLRRGKWVSFWQPMSNCNSCQQIGNWLVLETPTAENMYVLHPTSPNLNHNCRGEGGTKDNIVWPCIHDITIWNKQDQVELRRCLQVRNYSSATWVTTLGDERSLDTVDAKWQTASGTSPRTGKLELCVIREIGNSTRKKSTSFNREQTLDHIVCKKRSVADRVYVVSWFD